METVGIVTSFDCMTCRDSWHIVEMMNLMKYYIYAFLLYYVKCGQTQKHHIVYVPVKICLALLFNSDFRYVFNVLTSFSSVNLSHIVHILQIFLSVSFYKWAHFFSNYSIPLKKGTERGYVLFENIRSSREQNILLLRQGKGAKRFPFDCAVVTKV